MAEQRRVLVIARHYWPTTTDATLRLRSWTAELAADNWEVTVATPKWVSRWPASLVCDQVRLVRIADAPSSSFRFRKFARNVLALTSQFARASDVIYCDEPDLAAHAIVTQQPAKRRERVLVRYSDSPQTSRPQQQPEQRVLDVLRRADKLIVDSATDHRRLLSLGIMEANILRVASSSGALLERDTQSRHNARRILGNANHDLFTKSTDRIVVVQSDFRSESDLRFLVAAIHRQVEDNRRLRVWLLGDGPSRAGVYEALRYEGIHRSVAMPGCFVSLEEVLQAADLFIFPTSGDGQAWIMPSCIRSGIPFLTPDSARTRESLFTGDKTDLTSYLYTPGDPKSLEARLQAWLREPEPMLVLSRLLSRYASRPREVNFLTQFHHQPARTSPSE